MDLVSEADDKRELLKLKQGIIEESDVIVEKNREKTELHGIKKFQNYVYHNKWYIICAVAIVGLALFLLIDVFTKEKADLRVMLVTTDMTQTPGLVTKVNDIEKALELYCPDFDNNGNVHVEVYFVDISRVVDDDYYYSNQAKLYGEINNGVAHLFICTKELLEQIQGDEKNDLFVDLEELYGESDALSGHFFKVSGSKFAHAAKWESSCPENMYIIMRKSFDSMYISGDKLKDNHNRAEEILRNIVEDKKLVEG